MMEKSPIWLNDGSYELETRERLRQLALWSPEPVYFRYNCGLPTKVEKYLEEELTIFQHENIVKLWKFENEKPYNQTISCFSVSEPKIIYNEDYQRIADFVDSRLEQCRVEPELLGFSEREGMLLEEVVLRRRFFSQAISGALAINALADRKAHMNLYAENHRKILRTNDILFRLFEKLNVPSLFHFDLDGFLELRLKTQRVLPEIVQEINSHQFEDEKRVEDRRNTIVRTLVRKYETELIKLVKKQTGLGAKKSYSEFENGSKTSIESQLVEFYRDCSSNDSIPWFSRSPDGSCKLALLLLEWKSK